jgi:hypothetical protein
VSTLVLCGTITSVVIFYLIWGIGSLNFHLVNRMLIMNESSIGDFLHFTLLQAYPCYYGLHIILFSTLAEYQS